MKIKKIRWEEPENDKSIRPINGYIGDKLVALIMKADNDCAHLVRFYGEKPHSKDKTFRIHKNPEKAKKAVQKIFEEFITSCIEEL